MNKSVIIDNFADWKFWYYQFTNKVLRWQSDGGESVLSKDWDNLIILDGCRFDLFDENNEEFNMDGELRQITTLASATPEFVSKTFTGEYDDIVYVTANPFVHELLDEPFHAEINAWDSDVDEDLGVVPPESMTKAVQTVSEKYPNKRIIAHYMQPHCPFIGDPADERNFWQVALSDGVDTVLEMYEGNLLRAFEAIEPLEEDLEGKTVITSDHGNALGERAGIFPIYGHPGRIHIDSLTQVPWYILEYSERKEIDTVDRQQKTPEQSLDANVEKRLKDVGYM